MKGAWVLWGLVSLLVLSVTGCGDRAGSGPRREGAGARVVALEGTIRVTRTGGEEVQVPEKGSAGLDPGDTVRAPPGSVAIIKDGKNVIQLGHDKLESVLEYKAPSRKKAEDPPMLVRLVSGLADFIIRPEVDGPSGERFRAETASVIAAVRGTQFQVEAGDTGDFIRVIEGQVEAIPVGGAASADAAAPLLQAGQQVQVPREGAGTGGAPAVSSLDEKDAAGLRARFGALDILSTQNPLMTH